MPELPEVETVRRGLEPALLGHRIQSVEQRRTALRTPFPENLPGRLKGRMVTALTRRAKYLLIHLDDSHILVIHLGMSGRLLITRNHTAEKHDHLILTLEDGAQVVLNDARRFGMVFLITEEEMPSHPSFKDMGPEPLGNSFSGPVLSARLKGKKTAIKQALLDQKTVAGIGNIYACEALFESGINPQRPAADIQEHEANRLTAAVQSVLQKAIESGGSSLRDHLQVDGTLGYFQHHFSVYDRAGERCPGCDCDMSVTGGIRRITQSGPVNILLSGKTKMKRIGYLVFGLLYLAVGTGLQARAETPHFFRVALRCPRHAGAGRGAGNGAGFRQAVRTGGTGRGAAQRPFRVCRLGVL